MPIPEFNDGYHLPPGEHICSLEEVESVFAYTTDKRQKVWNDFKGLLDRMKRLNITPSVLLIDGSFVTGRKNPGDVDFACLIKPGVVKKALKLADSHDKQAILTICNEKYQEHLRNLFGTHPLIVDDDNSLSQWSVFLRRGGPNGLKEPDYTRDPKWVKKPEEKGILRIELTK